MSERGERREALPVERFDYELPPELIAQEPIEPRDASRMLVLDRRDGTLHDRHFHNLPDYLEAGDLIVLNDTRVLPARLYARRGTGGEVELLLLARRPDETWTAMARPLRRLRDGEQLRLVDRDGNMSRDCVQVVRREADEVVLRFDDEPAIERHGRVPLPPYIRSDIDDPERYQTVYAARPGSAAAPTAGMHFTAELIERCRAVGADFATITLHVGLDTFQPIKTADAREHRIHSEWFHVPVDAAAALRAAKDDGRRVIAVGTTSVRTLESTAEAIMRAGEPHALAGSTELYITPGYAFRMVDAMITNFHLPRTTLILLVSAFAGEGRIREAYRHAIRERYRFYSFGDAMLIV